MRPWPLFLLVPALPHGLEVVPDSVVIKRMAPFEPVADSVVLHNRSGADLRIDSITIRFLDGDPHDFSRCKACPAEDGHPISRYKGWVYWGHPGPAHALHYLKDSLFPTAYRPRETQDPRAEEAFHPA